MPSSRPRRHALVLLLCLAPLAALAQTPEPLISAFPGIYVGVAADVLANDGPAERRDIEIVIRAGERGVIEIDSVNVTLVGDRRDVPGVRYAASAVRLAPRAPGFYTETRRRDPFGVDDPVQPMRGDALRWAVLDESGLTSLSFGVLEDGRYELQEVRRRRVPDGLEVEYRRIVDGVLVRRMVGFAVKVEERR